MLIVEKMAFLEVEINKSVEDFSAPNMERSQNIESPLAFLIRIILPEVLAYRFTFFPLNVC